MHDYISFQIMKLKTALTLAVPDFLVGAANGYFVYDIISRNHEMLLHTGNLITTSAESGDNHLIAGVRAIPAIIPLVRLACHNEDKFYRNISIAAGICYVPLMMTSWNDVQANADSVYYGLRSGLDMISFTWNGLLALFVGLNIPRSPHGPTSLEDKTSGTGSNDTGSNTTAAAYSPTYTSLTDRLRYSLDSARRKATDLVDRLKTSDSMTYMQRATAGLY
jgi:hypothetical protein